MVDVMAIGSHPDDIEFGCGAVLAKLAKQNKSIIMVDLTVGDKGTFGTPAIRKEEGENAAKVIGARRVYLGIPDCEVFDTYENRLKLVRVIREYKPILVLAPYWKGEQTHPDHLATGLMARYACRYSRFAKILPELPIHRPDNILHYVYPPCAIIDFLVDVSDEIEVWKKMINCHHSQVANGKYLDANMRVASMLGVQIGKAYAQGLVKGNPIEIDDVMSLSKGTLEI